MTAQDCVAGVLPAYCRGAARALGERRLPREAAKSPVGEGPPTPNRGLDQQGGWLPAPGAGAGAQAPLRSATPAPALRMRTTPHLGVLLGKRQPHVSARGSPPRQLVSRLPRPPSPGSVALPSLQACRAPHAHQLGMQPLHAPGFRPRAASRTPAPRQRCPHVPAPAGGRRPTRVPGAAGREQYSQA